MCKYKCPICSGEMKTTGIKQYTCFSCRVVFSILEIYDANSMSDEEKLKRWERGEAKTDILLEDAKKVSLEAGKVSVSVLQRKLDIGYIRAARILDELARQGFCEGNYDGVVCGRRIISAPLKTPAP